MSMNGIDISNHQAGLNIAAVPCDFVILKATEGTTFVDKYCDGFYQKAKSLGKKLGVYHFASGKSSGTAEADFFLENVKGYVGEAILVLDWEAGAVSRGIGYAKEFLDRVQSRTGVKPLLYSYNNCINSYDWSSVAQADYGLWNAGYYAGYQTMGYNPSAPIKGGLGAFGSCAMYQYTSSGRLPGWNGNLDLDVFYGDANTWDAYAAGKGSITGGGASSSSPTVTSGGQAMTNAQIHINNFTSAGIPVDGLNGPKTRKGIVMSLQHGCNLDYKTRLVLDGIIGNATNRARGQHYVRRGETQYLVTFVEIGLTALGYYSGAVETPGVFGSGLEDAVGRFQKDTGLRVDKIAGRNTMDIILRKLGCI